MKADKNIIKGNKVAEQKVVKKHNFYAVVDVKSTVVENGEEKTVTKSLVYRVDNSTRMDAKRDVNSFVKSSGGKLVYFGGFKN